MKSCAIGVMVLLCALPAQAQFALPNDQGVSFGHMHLVVADLELHKRLWTELFGARLVEKEGYTAVWLDDALIFFREGEPTAPSADTSVDHFGIKVRFMAGVLAKWRTFGYQVDSQTTNATGNSLAFVTMPGGVRLALEEEPNLHSSASMSYVHFVTPSIGELSAWYAKYFGASTIARGNNQHIIEVPGSQLRFESSVQERLPTDGTAIDHVGYEVRDWDAFIEMLKEANIQFEFGPVHIESLNLWVAFFNDPSGGLVEITHGLDRF